MTNMRSACRPSSHRALSSVDSVYLPPLQITPASQLGMPTPLVTCGLLTSAAIIVCIVYDETIGFNMVMCLFCVLAIVSLWTKDEEEEKAKPEKEEKKE